AAIQRGDDTRRHVGGDFIAGQRGSDIGLLLKIDIEITKIDRVEQKKARELLAERVPEGPFAPVIQLLQDAHGCLLVMFLLCAAQYWVSGAFGRRPRLCTKSACAR